MLTHMVFWLIEYPVLMMQFLEKNCGAYDLYSLSIIFHELFIWG